MSLPKNHPIGLTSRENPLAIEFATISDITAEPATSAAGEEQVSKVTMVRIDQFLLGLHSYPRQYS